jgi:hypothetical protein
MEITPMLCPHHACAVEAHVVRTGIVRNMMRTTSYAFNTKRNKRRAKFLNYTLLFSATSFPLSPTSFPLLPFSLLSFSSFSFSSSFFPLPSPFFFPLYLLPFALPIGGHR